MSLDAAKRRLRALSSVARMDDHRLQEAISDLLATQGQIDRLRKDKATLRSRLNAFDATFVLEVGRYLAQFTRDIYAQQQAIDKRIAELEVQAEKQASKVQNLYRGSRTTAIVRDRAEDDVGGILKRRETIEIEENSIGRFIRSA